MRRVILVLLIAASCKSISEAEQLHRNLSGNWLVISPDPSLNDGNQEIAFSHIQDSINQQHDLKLVSLSSTGVFQQMDSDGHQGRWGMTADNILFIERGGVGFDNFSAQYTSYKSGMLQLTQIITAEDSRISLLWHIKKVTGDLADDLFAEANNTWRNKALHVETEPHIKERLTAMLRYYSSYYRLISKECSFFISSRVHMPFKFYRHGITMDAPDQTSYFSQRFYDSSQASKAWEYLHQLWRKMKNDFPKREDFLLEYADFMEEMAKRLKDGD